MMYMLHSPEFLSEPTMIGWKFQCLSGLSQVRRAQVSIRLRDEAAHIVRHLSQKTQRELEERSGELSGVDAYPLDDLRR